MRDDGLTLVNLRDCLAGVEPVRLSGMTLFERQGHPRGAFPDIPREELIAAVTEMIAYTRRCQQAALQLGRLAAVPLTTISLMEYGL